MLDYGPQFFTLCIQENAVFSSESVPVYFVSRREYLDTQIKKGYTGFNDTYNKTNQSLSRTLILEQCPWRYRPPPSPDRPAGTAARPEPRWRTSSPAESHEASVWVCRWILWASFPDNRAPVLTVWPPSLLPHSTPMRAVSGRKRFQWGASGKFQHPLVWLDVDVIMTEDQKIKWDNQGLWQIFSAKP